MLGGGSCPGSRCPTFTNYYVISLAVADLLVALVGIPSAVATSVGLPSNYYYYYDYDYDYDYYYYYYYYYYHYYYGTITKWRCRSACRAISASASS